MKHAILPDWVTHRWGPPLTARECLLVAMILVIAWATYKNGRGRW